MPLSLPRSLQPWLSLVFKGSCRLCQRSAAQALCAGCWSQVRQCRLAQPTAPDSSGLTVLSWGRYEGNLRRALRQLKYDGHTDLAPLLGSELGQAWLAWGDRPASASPARPVVIVPIPLHSSRLQQRGFNQADLLAQGFCRQTRLPLRQGLLRVQATQAQHRLSRGDRQHNLAAAFAVAPDQLDRLRRSTVWLLDDIFTTGATASAAARALGHSGIAVGGVCTVARALPWAEASPPGPGPRQHP